MTEPVRPHDPALILDVLHRQRVDYVVIGGVAVQAHGSPRTTQDLDLLVSPMRDNLARLAASLHDLDAMLYATATEAVDFVPDAAFLATKTSWNLTTPAGGRLDLWIDTTDLAGARGDWSALRERALEIVLAGATVPVVGRDDLISMKRAAGRERDLADVAVLTSLDARGQP